MPRDVPYVVVFVPALQLHAASCGAGCVATPEPEPAIMSSVACGSDYNTENMRTIHFQQFVNESVRPRLLSSVSSFSRCTQSTAFLWWCGRINSSTSTYDSTTDRLGHVRTVSSCLTRDSIKENVSTWEIQGSSKKSWQATSVNDM